MLTEKQKIAAQMLYEGERVQDIAIVCGVHRVTVWRWTKKKEFIRELRRLNSITLREYRYRRYNAARRMERAKRRMEREWDERIQQLEGNLKREADRIGKNSKPPPAFYRAFDTYEKALFELPRAARKKTGR